MIKCSNIRFDDIYAEDADERGDEDPGILGAIQGCQPDSRYKSVAEGNPGSIQQEDERQLKQSKKNIADYIDNLKIWNTVIPSSRYFNQYIQ